MASSRPVATPSLRAATHALTRRVRATLRPGRRVAFAAAVGVRRYGGLKLHRALGGEVLRRQSPLPPDAMREMLERDGASVASHWGTVVLALLGVALATTKRGPRLVLVGVPGLLAVLMLARAGYGIASDLTAENANYPATGTSRCGRLSSPRGASLGG